MAKCAVFDSEDLLVEIYDSKKEAKAHNKGDDLKFIDPKNFPEGGIGEYQSVEDLFPPKEKPVKEQPVGDDGEPVAKRTRTAVKLTGVYSIAKADGARCPEGDARNEFVQAMLNNDTCEDFFAAVPAEVTYTNLKGEEAKTTAKAWFAYASRRGWIKLANQNSEVEVEVEEEAA